MLGKRGPSALGGFRSGPLVFLAFLIACDILGRLLNTLEFSFLIYEMEIPVSENILRPK